MKYTVTVNVLIYGIDDLFPYISHFNVNQSGLTSIILLSDILNHEWRSFIKSQSQIGEEDISSSGSAQGSNNNTSPLKGNSSTSFALSWNTQLS